MPLAVGTTFVKMSSGSAEEDHRTFFEFVLHGIITNSVAAIGFFGNIICIAVLRRPAMRHNSTNVILAALATFDVVLIMTSVLMLR